MPDTASTPFVSLTPDNRPTPVTPFDHTVKAFLDDFFAAQPVLATQTGFHAYDDRWPDMSEAGRQSRLAMLRNHAGQLGALADADLSADEQIDRGIALEAIEAMLFEEDELREPAWDALSYVSLAGSGLFSLMAREFAPWAHRGAAFAGRLRGLPELFDAAAAALTCLPGRPVSRLHAETALAQMSGIPELIDEGAAAGESGSGAEPAVAAAIRDAAGPARAAVTRFEQKLRDEILPRAQGEARLGADLFAKKLRHTLASDLAPDDLAARARRDYDLVRAEMLRLAR